jgi:hypothetical protein
MQDNPKSNDPFSWTYLLAAIGVLAVLPLMHVVIGWFIFYL